jgi:protein arginine kinase
MNWEHLFNEPHVWSENQGPQNDVVLSSRIRIARNLLDRPFPARLDYAGQREVLHEVVEAAAATPSLANAEYVNLHETRKLERQFLMERHLISPEMASEEGERGVLISPSRHLSLMINEEDHLRLQSFESGLALREAWKRADVADSELGEKLPFAYDSEWGFCTRCPTNVGTGMRASCLLHLPALAVNGDIDRVLEGLPSLGVTARGFYGEKSKAIGDLFQISNSTSLGHSEEELIENIERVVHGLIQYERQAREGLNNPHQRTISEDQVFRAWAILLHARLISYDEAMTLLSNVRLGLQMGFPIPVKPNIVNQLMLITQPGHLQLIKGSTLKAEERDRWRAVIIRNKLNEASFSSGQGSSTES